MIKLTDREVLFVCYGALKAKATRRELGNLVDSLEQHLFPPQKVKQFGEIKTTKIAKDEQAEFEADLELSRQPRFSDR